MNLILLQAGNLIEKEKSKKEKPEKPEKIIMITNCINKNIQ